jgi:hypothetical protein
MSSPTGKYRELAARVGELRPILEEGKNAGDYLALFDEFVREAELGLAPHAACDYLLEREAARSETSLIEKIEALHGSMELEDDCVDRLRKKAAQSISDC